MKFVSFCLRYVCVTACLMATPAWSLSLSDLFADNMVFQREKPIRIWGKAAAGTTITIHMTGSSTETVVQPDGSWLAELPALPAGGPHEIVISNREEISIILRDVFVGDVWFAAGQSNMGFRVSPNIPWSKGILDYEKIIASSADPQLRIFTTTTEASEITKTEPHGIWLTSDPSVVGNFSAVAYLFGRNLREGLKIPIGVIVSSVGGTSIQSWMDENLAARFPRVTSKIAESKTKISNHSTEIDTYRNQLPTYRTKAATAMRTNTEKPAYKEPFRGYRYQPTFLYNAMIAPFTRFPVKGFIWYQGESDSQIAAEYGAMFRALISDWRTKWKEPEAPFLFVQLAGYDPVAKGKDPEIFGMAFANLRAAQAEALHLSNTGMAIAADVGEALEIHPRNKNVVAERLAHIALESVYKNPTENVSPTLAEITWDGDDLLLRFDTLSPLNTVGNKDTHVFDLVSKERKTTPRHAQLIAEDTVKIHFSEEYPKHGTIRYGWKNFPTLWLYDKQGLPVAPFETAIPETVD